MRTVACLILFIHLSRISSSPNVFLLPLLFTHHPYYLVHKSQSQLYILADIETACSINAVKAQYIGDTKPFYNQKVRNYVVNNTCYG